MPAKNRRSFFIFDPRHRPSRGGDVSEEPSLLPIMWAAVAAMSLVVTGVLVTAIN